MNILVVGGGGREHALVWKLKQSPLCHSIACAPGNAGIGRLAELVPIRAEAVEEQVQFAAEKRFDLVVIGPEAPLAAGLADALRAKGIRVFGPSQKAARIESSKIFARRLMEKYGIPSPAYQAFENPEAAKSFVRELAFQGKHCVVKADGLAAGKGAIVTSSTEEADAAIEQCLIRQAFGEAGRRIVVEERLTGPEVSILAITDGRRLVILPPAQDHKPIGEGDTGPNTGGMGAYSPVPLVTEDLLETIRRTVLEPAVRGMEAEGAPYTGVLYAGLMICGGRPYVIEFNSRFGDPETQAVLPALDEDLLPYLVNAAEGTLHQDQILDPRQSSVCVIMASGGYPGAYEKGKVISGLEAAEAETEGVLVFHSGTQWKDGRLLTTGGRVLGITGQGRDFQQACQRAYAAVEKIHFEKAYYRRDIGFRVCKR